MAYIGKEPQTGAYSMLDSLTASATASYSLTLDSVAFLPESANHLIVSLNGVIQKAGSSYNVSGSTLTFSSTLASSDSIDFVLALGNVLDIGTPSDSTVTNAKTNFVSTSSAAGLQIKGDNTTGGTLQLNCEQNSHGIKLRSPAHSAGQSYTLTFPTGNVTADKFLKIASVSGSGATGIGQLSFADAGGGAKTLLNTTTVSSDVSNINFDSSLITTTYQVYEIIIEFLQTDSSSGNEIQMQYSSNNGSSFESGLDEVLTRDRNSDISTTNFRETSTNQSSHVISSGLQTGSSAIMSGVIKIFQPMTSSLDTLIRVDCQNNVPAHGNNVRVVHGAVQIDNGIAINYVRIGTDGGNISAAKVKLYGVT
jgi:hypothetical protein